MSANFNALFKRNKISFLKKYKRAIGRLYSKTKENTVTKQFSDTVLLPQTSFPLRISVDKRKEVDEYLMQVIFINFFCFQFSLIYKITIFFNCLEIIF